MPSTPKPAGGYPASDHCQWNWWQLKVAPSFKLWPKVPFSHPPDRNHGCLSWGCPVWMLIFAPNLTSEASCLVPHSRGQTLWGIYPGQVRNLWQSGMARHAKQWHPRKQSHASVHHKVKPGCFQRLPSHKMDIFTISKGCKAETWWCKMMIYLRNEPISISPFEYKFLCCVRLGSRWAWHDRWWLWQTTELISLDAIQFWSQHFAGKSFS